MVLSTSFGIPCDVPHLLLCESEHTCLPYGDLSDKDFLGLPLRLMILNSLVLSCIIQYVLSWISSDHFHARQSEEVPSGLA